MSEKRIAVALSGGVDSAVTALLLQRAGYALCGVTLRMHPDYGDAPAAGGAALCRTIGIPHRVIDCTEDFRRAVTAPFCAEYAAGRTPNPCVLCNEAIKFPAPLRAADAAGCAYIATGHYARVVTQGGRLAVACAADAAKDQSYMLWRLPQDTLRRLLLPLGAYTKPQVRAIAAEAGIEAAGAKDSQDICFIPDGDYTRYLADAGLPLPPGTFVSPEGEVLGAARNQACFTVGQRRSLGIALGRPMYVTARDAAENRVVISPEDPYAAAVQAEDVRCMGLPPEALAEGRRLTAKFRYTRDSYPCTAQLCGGRLTVTPDSPVRAPAPGQSLVLYDGDAVAAGGIICDWR